MVSRPETRLLDGTANRDWCLERLWPLNVESKKNLRKINVLETTIRHPVLGRFGSGLVLLKPAPAGTGVIAGGPVRAVIQAVGIPNVLTKSIGSHNAHNVVKATIAALEQLCDKRAIAEMRGLPIERLS